MTDFNTEHARFNMIEQQVRTWEVLDQRVLDVLAATRRERYVPAPYRNLAFADLQLPLGSGEVMMAPKEEGRVLQALAVKPSDRVLEIGTGSGYLSACLAGLGATVTSIERDAHRGAAAAERLAAEGIQNVNGVIADAFALNHAECYDVVAVTGSTPVEIISLRELLATGGRLFMVLGTLPVMEAVLITRVASDAYARESLYETALPPLHGVPQPPVFRFY